MIIVGSIAVFLLTVSFHCMQKTLNIVSISTPSVALMVHLPRVGLLFTWKKALAFPLIPVPANIINSQDVALGTVL